VAELITARIRRNARELKLPGLYDSADQLIERAEQGTLGYREFLDLVLEDEVGVLESRRYASRLKLSALPHHKTGGHQGDRPDVHPVPGRARGHEGTAEARDRRGPGGTCPPRPRIAGRGGGARIVRAHRERAPTSACVRRVRGDLFDVLPVPPLDGGRVAGALALWLWIAAPVLLAGSRMRRPQMGRLSDVLGRHVVVRRCARAAIKASRQLPNRLANVDADGAPATACHWAAVGGRPRRFVSARSAASISSLE
jgi:hypothetical protein